MINGAGTLELYEVGTTTSYGRGAGTVVEVEVVEEVGTATDLVHLGEPTTYRTVELFLPWPREFLDRAVMATLVPLRKDLTVQVRALRNAVHVLSDTATVVERSGEPPVDEGNEKVMRRSYLDADVLTGRIEVITGADGVLALATPT